MHILPVELETPKEPEKPKESEFWYTEAMNWAKNSGICDGTRPDEPATRAEVVQMLYNYSKIK